MRSVSPTLLVLPTLLAAALSGCEAGGGPGPGDSPGDPGQGPDVPAGAILAERLAVIGEVTGAEEYQHGYVGGVTMDGQGRVYVADRLGHFVRVYGADGRFLRQLGREGAGPGEYQHPTDVFFDDAGRLWVRDARRATALATTSPGAIPDSAVETRPFAGYTNWTSSARSRLVDGLYWYPGYRMPRFEPTRYFYFAYDHAGLSGDTVPVPAFAGLRSVSTAVVWTSPGSGRMVHGLSRAPFEPRPVWELTPDGTVLGGDGRGPLVETTASGDTIRTLVVAPPRAVGAGERADSAAALRARIDSLPVPLDRVENVSDAVRAGTLPDTVSAYTTVHTDADGRVWVRRWPPEGDPRTWYDVYTRDGRRVRTVVLPDRLWDDVPPHIAGGRLVGVVLDPATEVHRVVVYDVAGGSRPYETRHWN